MDDLHGMEPCVDYYWVCYVVGSAGSKEKVFLKFLMS